MAANFPALPAPATKGVEAIPIETFLEAMHGPAAAGVEVGEDPSNFRPPRLTTVDVRSPAEFELGHIPGAINIPLFSNDVRAEVGTAFTQKSRFDAIRLGLQRIGPEFGALVDALKSHGVKAGDALLVYCWRGGMRSGSVAWLYSLCGFSVRTLQGGYRSYRRWCKDKVGNPHAVAPCPVMVLGGCTGVGKTAVLLELRRRGEQAIDLEALANHRGSAFGSMGQAPQPSNESVENTIALAVRRLDPQRRLWLEHEGSHVGKVLVPFGMHSWVRAAPGGTFAVLDMSRELRVRRLVEDYCNQESLQDDQWVDGLKTCIATGLAKKLGGLRVKEALVMLDEGRWHEVADMMLSYYDKLYTMWVKQSKSESKLTVACPTEDAAANAALVLSALEDHADGGSCSSTSPARGSDAKDDGGGAKEGSIATDSTVDFRPDFIGACFCGEVKVACCGEPKSVSYCHCSNCRRLSGAPFSCQALFSADQVQMTVEPGASLHSLPTSKGVVRSRCATCMSPVQATLFGGKIVALPLGLLTEWRGPAQAGDVAEAGGREANPTSGDALLRPRHHLHYDSRVMDVRDGLPKYKGAYPQSRGKTEVSCLKGILPESEW